MCNNFRILEDSIGWELIVAFKSWCDYIYMHRFGSVNILYMLKKCFRKSVNEKHQSFSTRWNVTTTQIILKDKDDIDALYPTK